MTTATLAQLMDQQREGMRYIRPRGAGLARIMRKVRALDLAPARRAAVLAALAVLGFTLRHALVLFGCTAVVISAAMVSPIAGWAFTGLAMFFLEARRR